MTPIRIVAISTQVAESVRATRKAPGYGHPAHIEVATSTAPCRHCLRRAHTGEEELMLFTLDPFAGQESLPLPGPVFIHLHACDRYPEIAGYPPELRNAGITLNGYANGRKLVAQEYATGADVEDRVQAIFERDHADYIHVRSTSAGCYTFRIEPAARP